MNAKEVQKLLYITQIMSYHRKNNPCQVCPLDSGRVKSSRLSYFSQRKVLYKPIHHPSTSAHSLVCRCFWDRFNRQPVCRRRGTYLEIRANPVSITNLMFGTVMEVSAMLVDTTIFLLSKLWNMASCSDLLKRENKGKTSSSGRFIPLSLSIVSRISLSVGIKISISPLL